MKIQNQKEKWVEKTKNEREKRWKMYWNYDLKIHVKNQALVNGSLILWKAEELSKNEEIKFLSLENFDLIDGERAKIFFVNKCVPKKSFKFWSCKLLFEKRVDKNLRKFWFWKWLKRKRKDFVLSCTTKI